MTSRNDARPFGLKFQSSPDGDCKMHSLGLSIGNLTPGAQDRHERHPYTVNALGLPPSLTRCLCTTNIIENPNGIVCRTSRRVTRYRDAEMALRWTATGFLEAQKSFRKIQGIRDLWILTAALKRPDKQPHVDELKLAA